MTRFVVDVSADVDLATASIDALTGSTRDS
jgi:hypothetical protein